jgi:hypothetical protein
MGISEAQKLGYDKMVKGFANMQNAIPAFVNIDAEMAVLEAEIKALEPLLPVAGDVLYADDDYEEIVTQQTKMLPFVNAVAGKNAINVPNIPKAFAVGIGKVSVAALKFNAFGDEGDRQLTKIGEALKVLAMKLIVNCGDQTVIDFYVGMDSKL